tara:strand:- start:3454 stop:3885 length:432 start_codon:yes stop_codon:yes gene_type:complete
MSAVTEVFECYQCGKRSEEPSDYTRSTSLPFPTIICCECETELAKNLKELNETPMKNCYKYSVAVEMSFPIFVFANSEEEAIELANEKAKHIIQRVPNSIAIKDLNEYQCSFELNEVESGSDTDIDINYRYDSDEDSLYEDGE